MKNSELVLLHQIHDNLAELITTIAKFEHVNFTIPNTQKIINNIRDEKAFAGSYDYRVIWTLKEAFTSLEDVIKIGKEKIDADYALKLNYILGRSDVINAGKFNTWHGCVGLPKGENYSPKFLNEKDSKTLINKVAEHSYQIKDVIDLFGKMIVHQLFNDCNKRTALLFCNALLLKKNIGFIDVSKFEKFNNCLTKYYQDLKSNNFSASKLFNSSVEKYFFIKPKK